MLLNFAQQNSLSQTNSSEMQLKFFKRWMRYIFYLALETVAVEQLVETLLYKLEVRGFDSR